MNKTVKISEVKVNPNNPRLIKDDKFKKLVQSVKDFPEMLNIRPIVVNKDMIILGGNMRYKACKEAGLKEVPIIITDLTKEQQKEFLIKDNVSGGEWDWDILANEWNIDNLKDWGLDAPIYFNDEDIDFDNINSNEDRNVDKQSKVVTCPKCSHKFDA
jgi:ParB-like chromosome segregation protein Spo0J